MPCVSLNFSHHLDHLSQCSSSCSYSLRYIRSNSWIVSILLITPLSFFFWHRLHYLYTTLQICSIEIVCPHNISSFYSYLLPLYVVCNTFSYISIVEPLSADSNRSCISIFARSSICNTFWRVLGYVSYSHRASSYYTFAPRIYVRRTKPGGTQPGIFYNQPNGLSGISLYLSDTIHYSHYIRSYNITISVERQSNIYITI